MALPWPHRNIEEIVKRPTLSRMRMVGVVGVPRLLNHRFTFTRIPYKTKVLEYLRFMRRIISPENPNRDVELRIVMKSLLELDYEMREYVIRLTYYAWKVLFREMSPDLLQSISEYTLDYLRPKDRYYIRVTAIIRHALAKIYGKHHGRFKDAIALLKEIPLDDNSIPFSTAFKIEINLLLGGLYVNTENPELGKEFLEKSKPLLQSLGVTNEKIQFCINQARTRDLQGDFTVASRLFHQLIHETVLDIGQAIEIRQSTIACSMMTPVGSWRDEFLMKLCEDHRYHQYVPMSVITKMHNKLDIILPSEIESLDPVMKPHHKEKTKYGINRLEYATCEHNLLVLSKRRHRIKINLLKSVLHVKSIIGKQIAAKMIAEGRLDAYITSHFINFRELARVANQTDGKN